MIALKRESFGQLESVVTGCLSRPDKICSIKEQRFCWLELWEQEKHLREVRNSVTARYSSQI